MKNAFLVFLLFSSLLVSAQTNARYITGIVSDGNDKPLQGIKVILADGVQKLDSTVSDAYGAYIFYNPGVGLYYVITDDSRYKQTEVLIETKAGYSTKLDLYISLLYVGPIADPAPQMRKDTRNYNPYMDSEYNRKDIINTPK